MSLTNEDLLAISQLLDSKLDAKIKPIDDRFDQMDKKLESMQHEINACKLNKIA